MSSARRDQPNELPPLRCTPLSALLPRWVALSTPKAHALVRQAETLHDTIEPDATYPLDFVAFKLTGFRRDYGDASLLFGVPLAHDLRWIIDAVSRSHPLPACESDAKPTGAWAESLGVHPRTLGRWRDAGLRWRWVISDASSPTMAHTAEAMEHFRGLHPERFSDAQKFSQLSETQRRDAVARAAQLAAEDPDRSLSDIAQEIANDLERAHETIRQLLIRQSRRREADDPFPRPGPLLSPKQRRQTFRDRRRGVSLRKLGERVGKSGPTLHRWLLAHRAAVLRRLRLGHVVSPLFDRPDASEVYLRSTLPEPADITTRGQAALLAGLPASIADLLQHTRRWDEETRGSAMLRMNFLKHHADTARSGLPKDAKLRAGDLDEIERQIREAGEVRRALVRGELLHLVSLLRRQAPAGFDPSSAEFAWMFDVGLTVLVDAIDTYNASGNRRFETYLRNRLQRALAPRVAAMRDDGPKASDEEARRRAVRRDAPTQADLAWHEVHLQLQRWIRVKANNANQPDAHDASA